jgi:hypothetical protein
MPPRLHLLLRRGGRVLLLLILMQAAVQSLQVARLTYHYAAQ